MTSCSNGEIECGGFTFFSNFDSGNLGRVELVQKDEDDPSSLDETQREFNLWTRPDCFGTEFENGNRTWFYFGVRGGVPFSFVTFHIVNLNKQSKMYGQGMCPVYKVVPSRSHWERIKEKPSFTVENEQFTLTFKHQLQDTLRTTTYFAFTYPFTYSDLQSYLSSIDLVNRLKANTSLNSRLDDIYFTRELVCYTLGHRRVDLLTISSYHNITAIREARLNQLFPDVNVPRTFKFSDKKVIFLSARVHPGETPSSFVMNGMISFLLCKEDVVAQALRRNYVFKIIPMLNPDGVFAGNYRTDIRGVNLNRVYNNPSPVYHSPIFAARSLIRYYHHGYEVPEEYCDTMSMGEPTKITNIENRVSVLSLEKAEINNINNFDLTLDPKSGTVLTLKNFIQGKPGSTKDKGFITSAIGYGPIKTDPGDSGLFLYIDMHGHASKKGIFMYGNHFEEVSENVECMLLPKLISLNSQHFHFESCNFSERNMYLKDKKDGSSREGAGRVAVLKATGLVRSYTLECNYNTGKCVNTLPPPLRECLDKRPLPNLLTPPKYTPYIYEEVGRSILSAVLDITGIHPNTRLLNSHFRSLSNLKEFLRGRVQAESNLLLHKEKKMKNKVTGNKAKTKSETPVRLPRCSNNQKVEIGVPLTKPKLGKVKMPRVKSKSESDSGAKKMRKQMLSDEAIGTWRTGVRLEKKTTGETRILLPEQRRKKLKPK